MTTDIKEFTNKEIIKKYGKDENDSGRSEVQISIFTKRIKKLTDHLKNNPKDNHTKYGLLKLVNQRKKILEYLKNNQSKRYQEILKELGLRK